MSTTQPLEKRSSESYLYDIRFNKHLLTGETLQGITAITAEPATTPALAIGTSAVNSSPTTYPDGSTDPAGTVVQVRISGGLVPADQDYEDYLVRVKATTNLGNSIEEVVTVRLQDKPQS